MGVLSYSFSTDLVLYKATGGALVNTKRVLRPTLTLKFGRHALLSCSPIGCQLSINCCDWIASTLAHAPTESLLHTLSQPFTPLTPTPPVTTLASMSLMFVVRCVALTVRQHITLCLPAVMYSRFWEFLHYNCGRERENRRLTSAHLYKTGCLAYKALWTVNYLVADLQGLHFDIRLKLGLDNIFETKLSQSMNLPALIPKSRWLCAFYAFRRDVKFNVFSGTTFTASCLLWGLLLRRRILSLPLTTRSK